MYCILGKFGGIKSWMNLESSVICHTKSSLFICQTLCQCLKRVNLPNFIPAQLLPAKLSHYIYDKRNALPEITKILEITQRVSRNSRVGCKLKYSVMAKHINE